MLKQLLDSIVDSETPKKDRQTALLALKDIWPKYRSSFKYVKVVEFSWGVLVEKSTQSGGITLNKTVVNGAFICNTKVLLEDQIASYALLIEPGIKKFIGNPTFKVSDL